MQAQGQRQATLHGTSVAIDAPNAQDCDAVFLRGPSGSGKSDLAFRLMDKGALLISDDQTQFELRRDKVFATGVSEIRGMMELRGVGLIRVRTAEIARLRLVVDLVHPSDVPRLPEWETLDILGVGIPRLRLHAFEASCPLKIFKALEILRTPSILVT